MGITQRHRVINDDFQTLDRNLLIHTERGDDYTLDGVLGSAFIHEATHTSMDDNHLTTSGWQAAMVGDGIAISRYAADYPTASNSFPMPSLQIVGSIA